MTKHRLPTLAAFAAAMALVPAAAQAAEIETALVSRASGFDGAPSESFSSSPSVSADGRFVAFASQGNALSDLDDDGALNVFVRDRATGATELVSRNGAPANGDSGAPQISPDGRFVLYVSAASNLVGDDVNGGQVDAFVFDRANGTTTMATRGPDGLGFFQGIDTASMSADGTKVVFDAHSNDLSDIDDDTKENVYLRDLAAGTTTLVSQDGGVGADGDSEEPVISGDGTDVAFTSDAENLAGGGAPNLDDVYVRNLVNQSTQLVSRPTGFNGVVGDGISKMPSISHSGRYVAFATGAENLVDTDADNVNWRVLRRDMLTGNTILVSRANGLNGAPNTQQADEPKISADGGTVAFASFATLDPAAQPGIDNIYTRAIGAGETKLASRAGADGEGANVNTFGHAISADGQTVAFATSASNLGEDGLGGVADVFVHGLSIDPIAPPQGGGGGGGGGEQPAPEPPVVEAPQEQPAPPVVVEAPSVTTPKLRMKLVRLGAKRAKVRVSCLAGECTGVLRLKRTPKQGGQRLGKATFTVTAGAKRTVTVKLRRQANAKKVRATATVRPTGLPKQVVAKKLRLR